MPLTPLLANRLLVVPQAPQPPRQCSLFASRCQDDDVVGIARELCEELARIAVRESRWDCEDELGNLRWDSEVEFFYRRVDAKIATSRSSFSVHDGINARKGWGTHMNLSTLSPPSSPPICPPIHSVKLRTKPTTSRPVLLIRQSGCRWPKLAKFQWDSSRIRSSNRRAEGSVGRRRDPPEASVDEIRSVQSIMSVTRSRRKHERYEPRRARSRSTLLTLIVRLRSAPTTTTPIRRIASSILDPFRRAAPSR